MTKDELLAKLHECATSKYDPETTHEDADEALVEYINDPEIAQAYLSLTRWYA